MNQNIWDRVAEAAFSSARWTTGAITRRMADLALAAGSDAADRQASARDYVYSHSSDSTISRRPAQGSKQDKIGRDAEGLWYWRDAQTPTPTVGDLVPAAPSDMKAKIWTETLRVADLCDTAQFNNRIGQAIVRDLPDGVLEGITQEQRRLVRWRDAYLANIFFVERQRAGTLICDGKQCAFDPVGRVQGTGVNPRSLMDVHHRYPLAAGERMTTLADFALLCPTCHRLEHALMRVATANTQEAL